MGRLFKEWLPEGKVYVCRVCKTHLALPGQLVSKQFRGRTGPAWLFERAANVEEGPCEDRVMTTGKHTITDIYCKDCGSNVGWRYHFAMQDSQKYKEGKYILERLLVVELKDPEGEIRICSLGNSETEME